MKNKANSDSLILSFLGYCLMFLLISICLVAILYGSVSVEEEKEDTLLQLYYEVEGGSIYTDHKGDTYFVENQDIEWLLVQVNQDGEVLNIK